MRPPTLAPATSIATRLKATPEQHCVVGPLVAFLIASGWSPDQIVFGKSEWLVPKRPSEAPKREAGHSFEGFPVDIALFDGRPGGRDSGALRVIVECKAPDEKTGVTQLETYLSLEPSAVLGVWTNTGDPSGLAIFLYRTPSGTFAKRRRPLSDLPRPGDPIGPEEKRLTFVDLEVPSQDSLRRVIEDLLDHVVINDSVVTRREEQLDQLCNLLLLKLDSDKQLEASTIGPPVFRTRASISDTARETRRSFQDLVHLYPEVFRESADRQLRFGDDTLYECVERLAPYRLIDVGVSTISVAFQALRSAALKQGEGQYFTPQQVIEAGVQLLRIEWNDLVIDPACGTGGFLVEVLTDMQRRHVGNEHEVARWAQTHIYGIDKDAIGVKLTKAIMQIAGDGSAHCARGDSIRTHEWVSNHRDLASGAFADGRFSVVVTNPPFGLNLKVKSRDARLASLDIAKRGATTCSTASWRRGWPRCARRWRRRTVRFPGTSSGSSRSSSRAAIPSSASPGSSARGATISAWSRSRAKGAGSVRAAAVDAWRSAPRTGWSTCCHEWRHANGCSRSRGRDGICSRAAPSSRVACSGWRSGSSSGSTGSGPRHPTGAADSSRCSSGSAPR